MSPADGSDFRADAPGNGVETTRHLPLADAILLHGGRALLLIADADTAPPARGEVALEGRTVPWNALVWNTGAGAETQWHGLAVLEAMPQAGAVLTGRDAPGRWRIGAPPRLDISPEPLAALVARAGASSREVYAFLVTQLLAGVPSETQEARALRAFARTFVAAAAEPDGFVEILATPETGGLFAQGWSMSLGAGTILLANPDEDLARCEAEVAVFARDDILPPGQGFAFFGKFWSEASLAAAGAVFFEKDGRLRRLDVVRGPMALTGPEATAHVLHMLPRLEAPAGTLSAFRRICRPRYGGADTLSGTALPIACAFDAVLQAPDGALLVTGWLLDPLRRVERAILKSSANLYAPVDAGWCALPRPDLARGFSVDPRFAGLLNERDAMHGFLAHCAATREAVDSAEVYLELVLDDGSCLFRPLTVAPFDSAERLPQLLGPLSADDPEIARIVGDHLAPFLASVPALPPRPARGAAPRPIRLGDAAGTRETQAVIPFQSWAQLQPMLALLAGTPEAGLLELSLVAPRRVASETLPRIEQAFAFFGLSGSLTIAPDQESTAASLDLGVAASEAPRVLAWSPSALPKAPGWLPRLLAEVAALPEGSLLSPSLIYEDGSICYGGAGTDRAGTCVLAGYGSDWLRRGAPRQAATGAAEIALVSRATLRAIAGFCGRLFGDGFTHLDLADRLARAGGTTWCSGSVDFWILDDDAAERPSGTARIIRKIDAALIARRVETQEQPGERRQ